MRRSIDLLFACGAGLLCADPLSHRVGDRDRFARQSFLSGATLRPKGRVFRMWKFRTMIPNAASSRSRDYR